MMNRMERVFRQNMENGRHSLVLYFPLGDPALGTDLEGAALYYENGADVLEMGLPYEDPVLDGATVRASMERALSKVTLEDCFASVKQLRKAYPDNVLQFMTYFGNVAKYGVERFAEICHECDVDAVLAPDATPEQLHALDEALGEYNIFNLRFANYTHTREMLMDLKANAKGYIFQQAVNGATGPQKTVDPQVRVNVKAIKEFGITTPCFAGFGIDKPEQAAEVCEMGADGIIVGSATLSHLLAGDAADYIKSLSDVM